jgi:hypothetical protein
MLFSLKTLLLLLPFPLLNTNLENGKEYLFVEFSTFKSLLISPAKMGVFMLNNWFIFILLPFLVFETLSLLIPCKRGI